MSPSEIYEGTLDELRYLDEQIKLHQELTALRAREYALMQDHRDYVLRVIRDKSKGGVG